MRPVGVLVFKLTYGNARTNDVSRENVRLTLSCFSRSFTSQQVQKAKVKDELLSLH